MNTKCLSFDGVDLVQPCDSTPPFNWPHATFAGFPPCCGPGADGGLTEKVIPETILGLNMSPACWIHDFMQGYGPPTWRNFHHSNSVFLTNLLEINRVRGGNWLLRRMRLPIIIAWYTAVASEAGAANFFAKCRRG